MELKVEEIKDLPSVVFNFEDLKKELVVNLEKYKGLVYTDENIKDAKTDRANLNKLSEAIDTRRKEIKNKYLEPYNKFEAQIKELEALINEPKALIDKQIKDFEEKEKLEKKNTIEFFFKTRIDNLYEILKFETIFNEKWLNKTYKIEDIQNEIIDIIDRTKDDFKVIEDMHTEFEATLKDFYLQKRDLTATLKEKTRLEEQKKKIEEQKLKQAEITQEHVAMSSQFKGESEPVRYVDFRVFVTDEQLAILVKFLKDNKIKYGKVSD